MNQISRIAHGMKYMAQMGIPPNPMAGNFGPILLAGGMLGAAPVGYPIGSLLLKAFGVVGVFYLWFDSDARKRANDSANEYLMLANQFSLKKCHTYCADLYGWTSTSAMYSCFEKCKEIFAHAIPCNLENN